jgi:L-amino acid N-acyltransferase YncA
MLLEFRNISQADWPEIKSIYESGISARFATFQTSTPSWNESHLESCRILAFDDNRVIGWAALSPVSKRDVSFIKAWRK